MSNFAYRVNFLLSRYFLKWESKGEALENIQKPIFNHQEFTYSLSIYL
jgi:hypothetical protein